MMRNNEDVKELLTAALEAVRRRLSTYYWNKNQKQIDDPFANTGAQWENDTFRVKAYSWGEEENIEPNFQWENISVWWYKYLGRGMEWQMEGDKALAPNDINKMLNSCIQSLPLKEEKE